ncbi:hypothetical protein NP493_156g00009 [Ridgeia piscesae]|uniref:Uncharacterized protein n=1 Tax=Ridgeia piscesae TaxID=27915 RepID=A0AAD9P4A9_RIDPI|nr:hypothetical protein NP493_156g00009 [Ridgeia piscesae]
MASDQGFYLTLPSNASIDLYPENTLTRYVTSLPQIISLSGQWECGLVEIQYPHSWYNIRRDNAWFAIVTDSGNNIDRGKIEVGYYDRPERLIAAINRTLKEAPDEKNVTLSYSTITQKVTVDVDPGTIFSMDMNIGFNNSFVTTAKEGDSVVDMAQGFYALYVYINVVEPRLVGDSVAPLLRIVPLEGKHGDIVSKSFDNVQYVPVLHKEFGTVEVDIRYDAGRSVPFEGGKIEHRPVASIGTGGPIEFLLPGSGDDYLDVANTYLYVQARVTKANGTDIDADTAVGPVNNWVHSLFSQVDVSLNGTLVTPSTNTYSYRAYIETLLSHGKEAKDTQLTSVLWRKDTAGHLDATDDTNDDLKQRRIHTNGSRIVDMMGRLHVDLFFQERYLLNGVDMKIRLVQCKGAFALMADGADADFKVCIVEAALFARKAKLNPAVQMAHIKALEKATAKYPLRRVDCKVFSIPRGSMSHTHENVYLGVLPKRVVLCSIYNDAYNGAYNKNPFNAKHNNMNFLALYVDGQQVPAKPLQPRFDDGCYVRSYVNLFAGTGKMFQDEGNDLTRKDFGNGYTLFSFDLTPDACDDGSHFNLVQKGNLRVEIHFDQPLGQTVNVIVYGEFESVLEIDRSRNIIYDY